MRGLAFPPTDSPDREPSYEDGTPVSCVDIPIDPLLGGQIIDPALIPHDTHPSVPQPQSDHQSQPQLHQLPPEDYHPRQYSEGPQGDPFAPQFPAPFFPVPQEQPPPPPKQKRKRKVYKEEDCSFCQGNESRNKQGESELLITCHECGRSGHPSCMQLERLADVVRSYSWKCIECKNCEVCQEKGDDDRILFCDWCDRGWHMDCMVPPLQEPPDGEWHCPACSLNIPTQDVTMPNEHYIPDEINESAMEQVREASVASSSRSNADPTPVARKRVRKRNTGKGRARVKAVVIESENEELEEPETPVVASKSRARARKSYRSTPRTNQLPSSDEEQPSSPVRPTKRRRPPAPPRDPSPPLIPIPRVRLRLSAHRGKGKEREEDEGPHGLFDDILSLEERDTSKTTIVGSDKLYFDRSRLAAEAKLDIKLKALKEQQSNPSVRRDSRQSVDILETPNGRARPLRSAVTLPTPMKQQDFLDSPGPSTPSTSHAPKVDPGVLRIQQIRFGMFEIKTWFDAPFPEEYSSIPDGTLWICEFCLKYMKSRFGAIRHQTKCKYRHPPGDEIYRDGPISIFEVDGRRNKIYCQNLCLLSKMFLDHKSLFYDVEPFLFYVITQVDDFGARFVGYFSKEKRCPKEYNLSCIMTLPVRQRQGWGNLLIDFSYLLSRIEQRPGSPEKPLSALGAIGYKNYWKLAVMRCLQNAPDNVRLEYICDSTAMTMEDVCNTLIQQEMIFIREETPPPVKPSPGQAIRYPKGRKHGPSRRRLQKMLEGGGNSEVEGAPFVPPKSYEIHFDRQAVDEYMRAWDAKGYLTLKPEKLKWTPYISQRGEQILRQPLHAMDTAPEAAQDGVSTYDVVPSTPIGHKMLAEVEEREEEKTELPSMVVDQVPSPAPTPRTRTRSAVKVVTQESTPTTRTTRSTTALSPLTPARSLRTRSNNATEEGVVTGRRVRKKKAAETVNDAAFAAKLAMEEQGRQLRSRRSESQTENVQPLGRKRRRTSSGSSSEMEVEETTTTTTPSQTEGMVVKTEEVQSESTGIWEDLDADAEGEPDPEFVC